MPRHATETSFKPSIDHTNWKGGCSNYWRREARIKVNCPKDKIVHHKDGNVRNNNANNLQIMTQSKHTTIHNKQRKGKIKPESILRKNINKVIMLRKENIPYKKIAKELNINKRMVKRCITTYNKEKEVKENESEK